MSRVEAPSTASSGPSLRVDPWEYDLGDAAATVRTTPRRWRWITEGCVDLPDAATVAMEGMVGALSAAGGDGSGLDDHGDAVWRRLDELATARGPRTRAVEVLGEHHPLLMAATECDRLLSVAARAVATGVGHHDEGCLQRIGISDGGAPKAAVGSAEVGPRGLRGDRQAVREHHGRPFQAVSVYSADLIDALATEGHPITPGAVGENLLLSGVDWASLRPGARLVVGGHDAHGDIAQGGTGAATGGSTRPVVLELNAWAPPCRTIARAFTDGRFDRIDRDKHPGWARAYAWVIDGGTVAVGSTVHVLP